MRQIRRGVFETNSSSTHSLTMCSGEEYEKWKSGEMLFDRWAEKLIAKSNVEQDNEDLYTYEQWNENWDLEHFTKAYTTKSGEKIIAFGEFGYDG